MCVHEVLSVRVKGVKRTLVITALVISARAARPARARCTMGGRPHTNLLPGAGVHGSPLSITITLCTRLLSMPSPPQGSVAECFRTLPALDHHNRLV